MHYIAINFAHIVPYRYVTIISDRLNSYRAGNQLTTNENEGAASMNDLISNILRGSVSLVMYSLLLFTLTKSKVGRTGTVLFITFVFVLNMSTTIWFYVYGDLTALSRFSLVLFIVVAIALKPLTRLNFMQWCFTFVTTINIAMIIIILSFHLGKLSSMPQYANTIFRFVLYLLVIFLFQRFFLPSYRSAVNNWPIFSGLMIIIFLNLSYYFFVTDDIQNTLTINKWPLILLVSLAVAAYGTVFYALKKFALMQTMETENKKIQEEAGHLHETALQLERFANYDPLTGLPNRRCFFERLGRIVAECERDTRKFVLFFIDLDDFKHINDTYGHEVGDQVLIATGNRLKECIRETDFVARLGGDEFSVVVHDIVESESLDHLSRRIRTTLQELMHIGSVECKINASIGIAVYPDSGNDSETLLKNADSAMYEIKKNGKDGIRIFMNKQS